eukprot:1065947-Pyramimonas_sp.AAC.2
MRCTPSGGRGDNVSIARVNLHSQRGGQREGQRGGLVQLVSSAADALEVRGPSAVAVNEGV